MTLNLVHREPHEQPFKYVLFDSVFSNSAHDAILEWLEDLDSWTFAETDFYEQYEVDVDEIELPDKVAFLNDKSLRKALAVSLSTLFGVELHQNINLIAHKLIRSQHIGIHNDVHSGAESHRLTVQINRGFQDKDGGFFMLFNSADPGDIHKILKPVSNAAVAFAISERSNHAVSTQHSGVRFALIFCFNEYQQRTHPPSG